MPQKNEMPCPLQQEDRTNFLQGIPIPKFGTQILGTERPAPLL